LLNVDLVFGFPISLNADPKVSFGVVNDKSGFLIELLSTFCVVLWIDDILSVSFCIIGYHIKFED